MKFFYLLWFLTVSFGLSTQNIELKGDCRDAMEIAAKGNYKFETTPCWPGEILDISGNSSNSSMYFEEETHTAWFQFEALADDHLTFKIYPTDTDADFDFMLFEYTDEDFCADVQDKSVKPIRSNISRNDPELLSATGLSMGASEKFVRPGPGNPYSQAIKTEKGDCYYLVLNNVHGTETGFNLSFNYYTTKTVSGVVKDEETGKAIENATVTWEEKHGEVLAESTTDAEGEYSFEAPVQKGNRMRDYVFSVDGKKYLFNEEVVTTSENHKLEPLVTLLPKLRAGLKMTLRNINFYGGIATPLPSSRPSFGRLLKLLRKNPSLEILIEGHTNGCYRGIGGIEHSQNLSENRANRVKQFLVKRGVSEERMKAEGFNCSQMLYPDPKTPMEQQLNRRVELRVISY